MSTLQFLIIILLQITIQIIIGLIYLYIKSYITKKGENLATIEDVKEINTKIENIKYEFAKLLEVEKNKNYLVSQRLNLYNSQKDDLIFRIFEEANELFFELNSPNLEHSCKETK